MNRSVEDLERVALEVAEEAGRLIFEGFRRPLSVSTKGPQHEVFTEYDERSEELVRRMLERRTPGIPIVGEEHGGEAGADLTWYIDPIDGTINFIAGHPFFAVSVGVMRGAQPLAGAVVAPALGLKWWGSAEGGAKRNGVACHVSPNAELSQVVMATGFPNRSGISERAGQARLAQYTRVCSSVRDIRRGGSAAIDLCFVADGTFELAWMRRISAWDIAAGSALVLGAGGNFVELEPGQPTAQYLATNRHVEPAFLRLLEG